MAGSVFGEFEALEQPQSPVSSVAARHRSSGLSVRIHFPPLTSEEMLKRIATRLRFDHPGLPRILQHGQTTGRFAGMITGVPYLVTEALDPVGSGALPQRWAVLRDRLIQLLECMGEAHAYNAFHGAMGFGWLFQQPEADPPVLCVEGWYIDGTGRIPDGMIERMIAPECADTQRLRPSELVQMDLYGVGYLAWELACGKPPRPRQSQDPLTRFDPRYRVPSGFAQWMQELLRCDAVNRPRAANIALDHLLEVDRLRRTIPPGSVSQRIPTRPPLSRAHGVRREEVAATLPLLAQRRVPLVGRTELQNQLWTSFRQTADRRRTQMLVLRGSAGAGKTRLADWLFRAARRRGFCDGLQARHGQEASTDHGLIGALRRHLQSDDLEPKALLQHCEAWLKRTGGHRRAIAKLLAALIHDGGGMTPKQRHQALRSLIAVLAESQPFILWIDDLQWGLDSLELLVEIMKGPVIPQLLIIGTVRDEALADRQEELVLLDHLSTFACTTSIQVPALSPSAMSRLTEEHLHLAVESAEGLRERSEGNPLFAIQWVNHAISERLVELTDDGLMLPPAALEDLPADALRLCWQRLEGTLKLLPPEKLDPGFKALTAAAVLGSPFVAKEWVAACEAMEFKDTDRLLHLALARQILTPSGERFRFSHGLLREAMVHEATQRQLLGEVREACGKALLDIFRSGRRQVASRLFNLLKDSGHLEDALGPLLVAADIAQRALDLERTESLLNEATELCNKIGLAERAPARIRLKTFQSELNFHRHQLPKAFEIAESAEALAEQENLPELSARARLALANITFGQGKLPEALELYRDLIDTNKQLNSPRHQAQALVGTARVLETLGEVADAKSQLEQALKLVPTSEPMNASTRAVALRHLAGISQIQGNLSRAQKLLAEALKLENQTGNQPALLVTMSFMGELCVHLGRPRRAQQLCSDAAAGLIALGSDRAHHALMQLAYIAVSESDAHNLHHQIMELDELFDRQPSARRALRIKALKLWLSAYHGDWSSWDDGVVEVVAEFEKQGIYDTQFANVLGQSALRVGQRGQATRALPILDLANDILQRLDQHEKRKDLRAAFRPLERLEQT